MGIENLVPTAILASANLSGAYTDIDDDPDSPDGSWLTGGNDGSDSELRVALTNPTLPFTAAATQTVKVLVRKFVDDGGGDPDVTVQLYENGTAGTVIVSAQTITSGNVVVTGTFTDADYTGNPDDLEIYVLGETAGGGPNARSIEIGAVRVVADTSVLGGSGTGSATATGTATGHAIVHATGTGSATATGTATVPAAGGELTLVGITEGGSGDSVLSVSVTAPATVDADDLLILVAAADGSGGETITENTTSDWTLVGSTVEFANTHVYYLRCDGTEDSQTWTFDVSTSETCVWQMLQMSGAHTTSAPEISSASFGASGDADPPSLTASWGAESTMWIAAAGSDGGSFSGGPSGYTDFSELDSLSLGTSGSCSVAVAVRTAAVATENPGAFSGTPVEWSAFTVAVRPGVAAGVTATGSATSSGTATGHQTVTGTASGTATGAGTATGQVAGTATATGAATSSGTASGQVTRYGTGSGTASSSGTATGSASEPSSGGGLLLSLMGAQH